MIKLSATSFQIQDSLSKVLSGITGNEALKSKLVADTAAVINSGQVYCQKLHQSSLYSIVPDQHVFTSMTEHDVDKLYPQYFVKDNKPAREIYNAIKNSAFDRCPFCGGIGSPKNLDHYLPKAHFAQFSIVPLNLIPACRDCNMDGKGQSYPSAASEQYLHPYGDADHFFTESWVFASYARSEDERPSVFNYYASPPPHWSDLDKQRVLMHFDEFDIASRYGTKAAEELIVTHRQVKAMAESGLPMEQIKDFLFRPQFENPIFANHWKRGMYEALYNHNFD